MPNRFDQLAVAQPDRLLSVFAAPPVYPLLRRPMGWMGEAVTFAALRMLVRDSVVGCNDLPCPADQLASCIAAPGERQLLPARWFVGLNKNTLHDDPTTASAAAARIIREKTGCNPDQYLKQKGFLNGQYRPAFHPDGSMFAAGLGMTAAEAAQFIAIMNRDGLLDPDELPVGCYGMAAVRLGENTVAVAAGWFEEPQTLKEEIRSLASKTEPVLQPAENLFYYNGKVPEFCGKDFLPRGRRRFPSVPELVGGAGSLHGIGGEISRLSFGTDDQKAVIRCIEEDGRSSLTFGYDGWITARCPSGVYAGKAVSMDESHFCGLLMNLDGVSRTEIRLAKTDGGLLLETKPESDSDEEFSLLFADAEGIA